MKIPDIPLDEGARLAALHELNLLDTKAEERFDRITRLAKRHFQVPISLVSLIDSDRQWFKSRQGLDLCESSRDISFCGHTILQDQILHVPDALKDQRFADNPGVVGPPYVRFYAGAPLRAKNGYRVGTLCIVDTQPRELDSEQLTVLRDLADGVEEELRRGELLHAQFEVFKKNQILNAHLFNTPLGAITWDPDFRVLAWNRAAERIFGFTAQEALGRHAADLIVPPGVIREKVDQLFTQLISASGGERSRNANVTKSGRTIICEWYNTPVFDTTGQVLEVISLVEDITERVQMEAELQASELRFRDFAEIASDWLWELDAQLRFSYLSDGFTRVSGNLPQDLIGKTRWDFAGAELADPAEHELWQTHRQTLENQLAFKDFQYQKIGKNGILHTYSVSGKPIYDEDGRFCGYRGSARDISHIVAYEAQLVRAKEAAERASRAKTDFLSSMSHELRTPLNAVIGYSQLMAMDEALGAEYREYSQDILGAGQHLLALINDMLDLSKIEAGSLNLAMGEVKLGPSFAECHELMAGAAQVKRVGVEMQVDSGMAVWADPLRLKQILLNLLSNAIKYNREGGQVRVLAGRCADDRVRIEVRDTGYGIAEDKLGQLFQPFNRLGAEKSTIEGTGIGLALTKRIVEMMDGRIGVQSTLGVGATFWVELPECNLDATRCGRQTDPMN